MKLIKVSAKSKSNKSLIKEIIEYKDLLYILAWRDIKVRYAQTYLGILWSIIYPGITLLIFVIVFGKGIKIDTGTIPYSIFCLSGISLWTYFSFVLNQSGQSFIGSQEMIKKIYFPRLVIPLSKSIVGLVDFCVALIILFVLLLIYRFPLSDNFWFFPFFLLLNILFALGIGIWTSALTIRFRDFQHVVPFIVQFGLYASPIAYPSSIISENFKWLYNLNPIVGIIDGFRWSLIGYQIEYTTILTSALVILVTFISSVFYFKKVEDIMADIL